MPTVIPSVPPRITVHLGAPSASADNVTVSFSDYVKNVASSEIYPTWEESALRANILAIVSFALNRVYTEFYRSRGYDFDITSSTAYDQFFVRGRSFFSNVSRLVDELFNSYLRRPGFVEPLAAKFCNGTTVTCEGLSQWGSQALAQQGYNSTQILRSYYGDVEIVANAPVQDYVSSYPGTPLRRGSVGPNVVVIQTEPKKSGISTADICFGGGPPGRPLCLCSPKGQHRRRIVRCCPQNKKPPRVFPGRCCKSRYSGCALEAQTVLAESLKILGRAIRRNGDGAGELQTEYLHKALSIHHP